MADQYNTTPNSPNTPRSTADPRTLPGGMPDPRLNPTDPTRVSGRTDTYRPPLGAEGTGMGAGLLVALVFVVVAILAIGLWGYNQNGGTEALAPASSTVIENNVAPAPTAPADPAPVAPALDAADPAPAAPAPADPATPPAADPAVPAPDTGTVAPAAPANP